MVNKKRKLTPAERRKRMAPLLKYEDKQRARWFWVGAVIVFIFFILSVIN